jgi:hypothetical protein
LKLVVRHDLPHRLRYAKVYMEAGPASVFFSLDGPTANWYASIGRKRGVEMTDREYTSLRAKTPAVGMLDDDGDRVIVKNSLGYEEEWVKPHWTLAGLRKAKEPGREKVAETGR